MSFTQFLKEGLPSFLDSAAETVQSASASVESIKDAISSKGVDDRPEQKPPVKIAQHESGPVKDDNGTNQTLIIGGAAVVGLIMLAYVMRK